ncbi:uncharacterized protein LOC144652652 [Oculina patagonica]
MALKCALFLCGFLVSLSSVISIRCLVKYCVNNYCFDPEIVQCPNSDDKCRTLTYNRFGLAVYRTCSHRCDEQVCTHLESTAGVTNCTVTCCNTDLCNNPANDEASTQITIVDKKKIRKEMREIKKMLDKMETSHH